jgi:hypothetical protein
MVPGNNMTATILLDVDLPCWPLTAIFNVAAIMLKSDGEINPENEAVQDGSHFYKFLRSPASSPAPSVSPPSLITPSSLHN